MNEPVAWASNPDETTGHSYLKLGSENTNPQIYTIPLYTYEQLHPRVKMTQAEFDEWKELYYRLVELTFTAYQMLNEILNSTHNSSGKYVELSKRVYRYNDSMSVSKNQAELANLFINYSPDNPEETIEIVKEIIPWKEYLNQFPITKRFI